MGITLHPNTSKPVVFANTRTGPDATLSTVYSPEGGLNAKEVEAGVTLFIRAKPEGYDLGYVLGNVNYDTLKVEKITWLASVANEWLQAYPEGYVNSCS